MDFHLVVMRYRIKISTDTVIRNPISPPIHHNIQKHKKLFVYFKFNFPWFLLNLSKHLIT
jgi:hypothetical protein